MRSLYRVGRQADALRAYGDVRDVAKEKSVDLRQIEYFKRKKSGG